MDCHKHGLSLKVCIQVSLCNRFSFSERKKKKKKKRKKNIVYIHSSGKFGVSFRGQFQACADSWLKLHNTHPWQTYILPTTTTGYCVQTYKQYWLLVQTIGGGFGFMAPTDGVSVKNVFFYRSLVGLSQFRAASHYDRPSPSREATGNWTAQLCRESKEMGCK